jgi:hypothetical protein
MLVGIDNPSALKNQQAVLRCSKSLLPHRFNGYHSKGLISFLAEKHSLLLPTQFGSRPSMNTTDTMLLVTHKIKNTWRKGKTVAALFLDVQGVFPNTVKEQLVHNMHMRRVPE